MRTTCKKHTTFVKEIVHRTNSAYLSLPLSYIFLEKKKKKRLGAFSARDGLAFFKEDCLNGGHTEQNKLSNCPLPDQSRVSVCLFCLCFFSCYIFCSTICGFLPVLSVPSLVRKGTSVK